MGNRWGNIQSHARRAVAALLLIATAPLLGALFIAVRLESKGPFFVRHRCRTLDNAPFDRLRIRSDGRSRISFLADRQTDDITALGWFLRTSGLRDLPQLWNILRGEMRFLGARPLPDRLHEQIRKQVRGFDDRLRLGLPGAISTSPVLIPDEAPLEARTIALWRRRITDEARAAHASFAYRCGIATGVAFGRLMRARAALGTRRPRPLTPDDDHLTPLARVAGLPLSVLGREGTVTRIGRWVEQGSHRTVYAVDFAGLALARVDPIQRLSLLSADLVAPIGPTLAWTRHALGEDRPLGIEFDRLLRRVLEEAEQLSWPVAVLASNRVDLGSCVAALRTKYPSLVIVETVDGDYDDDVNADALRESGAKLVLVARRPQMAARWMREFSPMVPAVMLAVAPSMLGCRSSRTPTARVTRTARLAAAGARCIGALVAQYVVHLAMLPNPIFLNAERSGFPHENAGTGFLADDDDARSAA